MHFYKRGHDVTQDLKYQSELVNQSRLRPVGTGWYQHRREAGANTITIRQTHLLLLLLSSPFSPPPCVHEHERHGRHASSFLLLTGVSKSQVNPITRTGPNRISRFGSFLTNLFGFGSGSIFNKECY